MGYCLAFPINELTNLEFTSKSYKWIRYATGIVTGAHDHLCAECDHNGSLPSESINLYYTTTNEEKYRIFLIDPVEKKIQHGK
jgi:hypothetical protein